jgi:hypothetical protein
LDDYRKMFGRPPFPPTSPGENFGENKICDAWMFRPIEKNLPRPKPDV